jgi:hypothetical protein
MDKNKDISRRGFLKNTIMAGGTLIAASLLPNNAVAAILNEDSELNGSADELLKGISDIHIHAMPDSTERSVNEYSMALDAYKAGYRSVMFKSNDFSSHDRAYLIRQMLPDFEVFGSLVMNKVHGDRVNVRAAEKAVKTTGNYCRCIWMPTLDAVYSLHCTNSKEKGIPVLNDSGKVLPEVVKVMEICAEANIIFATGHSSADENLILAQKAREVGLEKFVVTHANTNFWILTADRIKQLIDSGAYIEYCALPMLWGPGTNIPNGIPVNADELISLINISPERSFISTDMGQINMPHPLEGMRTCIKELLKAGLSGQVIDLLVRTNPAYLVGID